MLIEYRSLSGKILSLVGASSILNPKDDTVLFVGKKMIDKLGNLSGVSGCLVFIDNTAQIEESFYKSNEIVRSDNPRRDFGKFLEDNKAELESSGNFDFINGSMIAPEAEIDASVRIYPGCYIESHVCIGEGTVIHSGVRVLAGTKIGSHCVIHDNVVIGSLSMAYEGDQRIPQVGGVRIGNNVHVGALSVICRGTIEDTVVEDMVKIDNCCSIAHNDHIGHGAMIICGAKLFGSVTVGNGAYISGGVTVKNGLNIGENSLVGMGSVVIHDVSSNQIVAGNPARFLRNR